MKKVLVTVLALVMCLGALVGCGKGGVNYEGKVKEGFIYETTGICPDAVMMTVNGVEVTAEEFFYWVGYGCSEFDYYGTLDWSADVGGFTMDEYIKSEAGKTAALYAVIKNLADKSGVTLSEEDLASIAADTEANAEYYGGMEAYTQQMEKQGVSIELMEALDSVVYLYNGVQEAYLDETSVIHPSENDLKAYADEMGYYTVKHVLFDIRECTQEEAAEKLAKAEEVMAALDSCDAEALLETFNGFVAEYGDDAGMASNPNGYTFTNEDDEALVAGFADACKALGENEYSDIVVTDYGYHIILRLPVDKDVLLAEYFSVFMENEMNTAEVEFSDAYETVSAQNYYKALIAVMEAMLAE